MQMREICPPLLTHLVSIAGHTEQWAAMHGARGADVEGVRCLAQGHLDSGGREGALWTLEQIQVLSIQVCFLLSLRGVEPETFRNFLPIVQFFCLSFFYFFIFYFFYKAVKYMNSKYY